MRFPPPVRITAPLIALVCGLIVTVLDYRLNLDLDLARHLTEVRDRADSNGRRLARLTENLPAGQSDVLQMDVEGTEELPNLEFAGIVDETKQILAASPRGLRGQPAEKTALSRAAGLINTGLQSQVVHGESDSVVISAHPFHSKTGSGWVLLEFDLAPAIAAAVEDARIELKWMASAMGILSVGLWMLLHFVFAARLARLSNSVRAFGEGRVNAPLLLQGGDEVASLASAFSAMAGKLRDREREQVRLEREVLDISERERRRIGHDLHDGLGQRLTAASMTTNALVETLRARGPEFASRAEEIGRELREAIAETRTLSHGLAPVTMGDEGLMTALSLLATNSSQGGVRCVFDCPVPVRLPDAELAGHMYRIAQEAVTNALKHASPAEIRIGLSLTDDAVLLEVDDDGEGFPEAEPAGEGIGLQVMRYRAQVIGGELQTGSPPAGGARITCRVPLSR
jgi:signal transduction histidine kinase